MEKEKFFMNEGNTIPASWNSSNFGMEIQSNDLNCSSEQLANCFFNPNWENSMDQSDPFESALSSIVSSPVNSNPGGSESIVLRELIGRLGSICNSGEISPGNYINGSTNNNSANNTSCYNTPLNSPPKLNLSIMDHQIGGNFPIPGNQFPSNPSWVPFSTDPGFVERAAKFSSLGGQMFGGLSRVSSNQSFKAAGSQLGVQESKDGFSQEGKFGRLSPENAGFGDSVEESSVSEQIPGGDFGTKAQTDSNARKRKSIPRGKGKEISPSTTIDAKVVESNAESNSKRSKSNETTGNEKEKGEENGNGKETKENAKPPEPPKDYIHVRARRGQATDSHSLAERVRREKISERMKFLQDLVPGCNKVTGKAVMLDEIINYVQSLQRQVEFLSMKLSTVNPRADLTMEALLSKDIFQSNGSTHHNIYPGDSSAHGFPHGYQSQQGANLHGNMPNGIGTGFAMNPSLGCAIRRNPNLQVPHIDGFGESTASQASTFWEDDLQSFVQMGFVQNDPQSLQGKMATSQMKVEL
ncbi:hypothetical protein LguiB_013330 [Lonicera macranthoides]